MPRGESAGVSLTKVKWGTLQQRRWPPAARSRTSRRMKCHGRRAEGHPQPQAGSRLVPRGAGGGCSPTGLSQQRARGRPRRGRGVWQRWGPSPPALLRVRLSRRWRVPLPRRVEALLRGTFLGFALGPPPHKTPPFSDGQKSTQGLTQHPTTRPWPRTVGVGRCRRPHISDLLPQETCRCPAFLKIRSFKWLTAPRDRRQSRDRHDGGEAGLQPPRQSRCPWRVQGKDSLSPLWKSCPRTSTSCPTSGQSMSV